MLAVSVLRTSTTMTFRPFLPFSENNPFAKTEYRPMCLGCACTGLLPQNTITSARFFTWPRVADGRPFSCTASVDGAWHTVAVLSMIAPSSSARSMPFLWTSHTADAQPYKRGLFEFERIFAASLIASSYETSLNSEFLSSLIIGASIL